MNSIQFRGVRIFDGTGDLPFFGSVVTRGQVIERVIRSDEIVQEPDCLVIDGHGNMLMPGLVEAHAHLTFPSSIGRLFSGLDLPSEDHLLVAAYNARVLLDHGFTSAYSAGSRGQRFEVALRNEIDAGYLPGPRLRASSQETSGSVTIGLPRSHDGQHERTASGLKRYVADMARMGVDSIKFELSGNDVDEAGGSSRVLFDEEEVAAIGQQARESDVWLTCHAQAAGSIKQALRHGFRALYHCTLADDEALDMLEQSRADVFVVPAPGLPYARVHEGADFGIDSATAKRMGALDSLEGMVRVCPELRKRGVRVLPGGDYGFACNPIGRNARDLQLFVELLGFSPLEALVAATRYGGELMGLRVGMVRPGYLADLLLVEGDPLSDIKVLQHKANLRAVMKGGQFHKMPELTGQASVCFGAP